MAMTAPTSTPTGLGIAPSDVSETPQRRRFVACVAKELRASILGEYVVLPHGEEPGEERKEVFLAHSPEHALLWICEHATRKAVSQQIRDMYADIRARRDADRGGEEDQETVGRKRKRPAAGNRTLAANKALARKMTLELAKTVASGQDWEDAVAPEALSVETQRFHTFAKKWPGVGVAAASQMISTAVAVGAAEVFRDWQEILAVWKRQHEQGRSLFDRVDDDDALPHDSLYVLASQSLPEGPPSSQMLLRAGVTQGEAVRLGRGYFEVQKSSANGLVDEMRTRWRADQFYEDYQILFTRIQAAAEPTGGRGRRYGVVAKELLFQMVYTPRLGRVPTKTEDPSLWSAFGVILDWGKRWNMLKTRVGSVGIFGLLPRSRVQNDFLQTRLTQEHVSHWVDMLVECNSDVTALAKGMEPMFLACMQQDRAPLDFSFIEEMEFGGSSRPLALLRYVLPTNTIFVD
jgi:hypothetical protein